uniref:Uncharacterized protein n=1 Tax=Timema monikensis TaxID=170555 RepID=A0A7R9HP33_9NEOP|nr:unnamed protein product [Timema monikensis]
MPPSMHLGCDLACQVIVTSVCTDGARCSVLCSAGGIAGATDGAWAVETDEIYDDATVTDGQSSPTQEHRDLSLHMQDDCVFSTDTRCLLR